MRRLRWWRLQRRRLLRPEACVCLRCLQVLAAHPSRRLAQQAVGHWVVVLRTQEHVHPGAAERMDVQRKAPQSSSLPRAKLCRVGCCRCGRFLRRHSRLPVRALLLGSGGPSGAFCCAARLAFLLSMCAARTCRLRSAFREVCSRPWWHPAPWLGCTAHA